jgi:uncharacterized membrane protein YgcG
MTRILLFLFCLFTAHGASALAPIPELTSPVIDTTGTLSTEQIRGLAERSTGLQREKGSQLQILLVPSTQPEDIAQYAQRVFDQWKLGREKADDGVLLIVAKEDRRVRIHVGYGLESDIPDIKASRIINENIIPYFKKGDYAGGVIKGSAALEKAIRSAEFLLPTSEQSIAKQQVSNWFLWLVYLIPLTMIAIVSIVAFYVQSSRKNTAKPEPIPDKIVLMAEKPQTETPVIEPMPSVENLPLYINDESLSMSVRLNMIEKPLAESVKENENKPKTNNEVIQNNKAGAVALILATCASIVMSFIFSGDGFSAIITAFCITFIFVFFLVYLVGCSEGGTAFFSSSSSSRNWSIPDRSWRSSSSSSSWGSSRSSSISRTSWSGGGGRSGGGGASGSW